VNDRASRVVIIVLSKKLSDYNGDHFRQNVLTVKSFLTAAADDLGRGEIVYAKISRLRLM
jgi:hypothetical protein